MTTVRERTNGCERGGFTLVELLVVISIITLLVSMTNATLDYLRWTDGGAFAAIPEPATMAILGLGGLMLRRRRNR